MLKEIYDQPQTAKNWWENYLSKNVENGQYQINYPFDTSFLNQLRELKLSLAVQVNMLRWWVAFC